MALHTHMQTLSSGMARAPDTCGKGLLLQSIARANGVLQQMALRTHMQTSSSGMARTPDACGKGLLLQSTARAARHRAAMCVRCSAVQEMARTRRSGGKELLLQSTAGAPAFRHPLPGVRHPTLLEQLLVQALCPELLQSIL